MAKCKLIFFSKASCFSAKYRINLYSMFVHTTIINYHSHEESHCLYRRHQLKFKNPIINHSSNHCQHPSSLMLCSLEINDCPENNLKCTYPLYTNFSLYMNTHTLLNGKSTSWATFLLLFHNSGTQNCLPFLTVGNQLGYSNIPQKFKNDSVFAWTFCYIPPNSMCAL